MRRGATQRGARAGKTPRLAAVALALALLLPLPHGAAARGAVPGHGRAWELVTAGPTNGVNLLGSRAWSDDGTRLAFVSAGPMPGAPSGDYMAVGLAKRESAGWVKRPIGEPYGQPSLEFQTSEPLAVVSAFSSWVWRSDQPLLPNAPHAPQNAFYRRAPDGTLTLLGPIGSVHDSQLVVASADAQHVVFQSTAHL